MTCLAVLAQRLQEWACLGSQETENTIRQTLSQTLNSQTLNRKQLGRKSHKDFTFDDANL